MTIIGLWDVLQERLKANADKETQIILNHIDEKLMAWARAQGES
jgi:hypothetical protein